MNAATANSPKDALLAALKAIVAECVDYPPEPRYSHDSYLPQHLLEAAQKAIEQVEGTEVKRFTTLQAKFALLGHSFHQSSAGDGPGPISYLAGRWGQVRHLPTLNDAEAFLAQVGGSP